MHFDKGLMFLEEGDRLRCFAQSTHSGQRLSFWSYAGAIARSGNWSWVVSGHWWQWVVES